MSLQKERLRWQREVADPAVSRHKERKDGALTTSSGLPLERVSIPDDAGYATDAGVYMDRLGFPGEYPFTRGVQPTMYRGRYWTMRQYAGFGTARESNERFRYLLDAGQTGLSVAFDLPTQIGYDSDHSLSYGEVGKVGVAVDSLADMEILFDSIPLDQVSTSMTINAPAAILLAMYIAVAEKQGVSRDKLRGTIQNDILKEYVARGTFMFPPAPSMRLITNTFSFCTRELPQWNSISISGYHIREAGSTAVQEVAFTLADAIAYVEAALSTGLTVDEFAGRLSFFFSAGSDLLEEVAKFRAARRMWARILKERFGATSPKSLAMRFHTQTTGAGLTAQQPDNNVVRVALHALAAVLGGTQSLHTNSRDEALSLPTEESVQIALRTQQIIALESGVANTVDPLAGSWVVESLTDEIERRAREYLDRIDREGGMVRAIENGMVQQEIEDAAYRYQREVEEKERLIVGVNCHSNDRSVSCHDVMRHDPRVQQAQLDRLAEVKSQRDGAAVERTLRTLREAATDPAADVMDPIIECVRQYATLGEISQELRAVFGEHQQHAGM
ncbi:MAG: methylmalonyl-CoA mutase [Spirochaetaceae bacterium]|nr:MAG: methylmalonyl-CoA mutase [Spirochaetaceae bacterium]